jgi:hypothetical protein
VKIFRNDQGTFIEWDAPVKFATSAVAPPQLETRNSKLETLSAFTGWWNGVATGDFDGDGKLDIVASNWGRNTPYESHREQPLRLLYGSWVSSDSGDLLEAYYDPAMQRLVPERLLSFVSRGLPFVRERYTTYEAFARASVEEILGERMKQTQELQAQWLETTVFLNRGGWFEARALPVEAQMAPAFAVCVGDMDGDGHEDLFLSQNFYATRPDTPRYDGGRGLWLRGDGQGGFSAVPGQQSGVKVYGEQRGAALCDYDGDGRVDLAVTQNGAETKLYRNVAARPGLRVRLIGPPGNPLGVGAALRLMTGDKLSPIREVHAGSGYWSQDSAVQVLALPELSTRIWVRWPGGRTTTSEVPAGAKEIAINTSGAVKRVR